MINCSECLYLIITAAVAEYRFAQYGTVGYSRKFTLCLKNCAFLFLSELRQISTNFNNL